MISSVADDQEETENVILDRDSPIDHERSMMLKHGYDFSHVEMETQVRHDAVVMFLSAFWLV